MLFEKTFIIYKGNRCTCYFFAIFFKGRLLLWLIFCLPFRKRVTLKRKNVFLRSKFFPLGVDPHWLRRKKNILTELLPLQVCLFPLKAYCFRKGCWIVSQFIKWGVSLREVHFKSIFFHSPVGHIDYNRSPRTYFRLCLWAR